MYAQRKRRLEKARYEHALNIVYSGRVEDKRKEEELERRKYARRGEEGFEEDRGGWKPNFVGEEIDLWQHIWKPPKGGGNGIRNVKVKLPSKDKWKIKIAATDENAWLGIPVAVKVRDERGLNLGPPERQLGADILKKPGVKLKGVGGGRGGNEIYVTKYNWVPAPFVQGSKLLQERHKELQKQK